VQLSAAGQFFGDQTTVTFEERGDQTGLTMRTLFASAEVRDHVVREFGAIEGCLGEYLKKDGAK
jgi:hypothetical protein